MSSTEKRPLQFNSSNNNNTFEDKFLNNKFRFKTDNKSQAINSSNIKTNNSNFSLQTIIIQEDKSLKDHSLRSEDKLFRFRSNNKIFKCLQDLNRFISDFLMDRCNSLISQVSNNLNNNQLTMEFKLPKVCPQSFRNRWKKKSDK